MADILACGFLFIALVYWVSTAEVLKLLYSLLFWLGTLVRGCVYSFDCAFVSDERMLEATGTFLSLNDFQFLAVYPVECSCFLSMLILIVNDICIYHKK